MRYLKAFQLNYLFIILPVIGASLLLSGCQSSNKDVEAVIMLGIDNSDSLPLQEIEAMKPEEFDEFLRIAALRRTDVAVGFIGSNRFPRLRCVRFENIEAYPLKERGIMYRDQQNRIQSFEEAIVPLLAKQTDTESFFYNLVGVFSTYLRQPRPVPVTKIAIFVSDCQHFENAKPKAAPGQLPNDFIALPGDVEVLLYGTKYGAADHIFSANSISYWTDLSGLLEHLESIMEGKS